MRRHDRLLWAGPSILFEELVVRLTLTRRWWRSMRRRRRRVDGLWLLLLLLLLWRLQSLLWLLLLLLMLLMLQLGRVYKLMLMRVHLLYRLMHSARYLRKRVSMLISSVDVACTHAHRLEIVLQS